MKKLIYTIFALFMQISASNFACAQIIFEDNFDSGKAGPNWADLTYVTVAALPSETGRSGNGLKFHFVGNSNDTADANAEARFDLKAEYKDISIEFDLYIPKNYVHSKPSDRADNNKFFRLWRVNYGEGDQVGASTISLPTGGSAIGADYKVEASWGVSTAMNAYNNFITAEDLGKWIKVKVNAVAPRNDAYRGTVQIWKNGVVIVKADGAADSEPGDQGWRYGYLLGWANSGFRQDTDLYIDNVKFFVEEGRPLPAPAVLSK